MACVLTVAVLDNGSAVVGHVGDSRLYQIRRGEIRKITHDHSPVGEREDARELTEIEAMRHPRRNEVFRDVGSVNRDKDDEGFVDVVEEPIADDGAIVLCTDGLTDGVPAATIAHLVREHAGDPQAVADALVSAANDAGGRDNVTVVYAEGPQFAPAVRGERATGRVPPDKPRAPRRAGDLFALRRAAWFACGALIGVVGALALAWR